MQATPRRLRLLQRSSRGRRFAEPVARPLSTHLRRLCLLGVGAGWAGLAAANALAVAGVVPWLPVNVHVFLVAAVLAATMVCIRWRAGVPVEAAFVAGMLRERAHGDAQHVMPPPMAAGAEATTVAIMRPGAIRHHRRPSPAPRPRRQD